MGLLTEILLLPVAPLRFTIWVAEQVEDEADWERHSQMAVVQQLREIAQARQQGRISEEEAAAAEARVIEGRAADETSESSESSETRGTRTADEGGAEDA